MIELTHIAENLIAEMYNRSLGVRAMFAEKLKGAVAFSDRLTAVPNLQLSTCAQFRFDGAHKIDMAILDRTAFSCVPCEAKLGNDRLGKTEFERRFLKPCSTSHRDSRIAGSMISILERKLPIRCLDAPILVNHKRRKYQVASPWILIMRETIYDSWKRNGAPSLSPACVYISFEAIVRAFGGKAPFNALIATLISFDYYESWKIY